LPVLTWKHPETNAAIFRCSQPRVGFAGARCPEDERLLLAIGAANAQNQSLFIFDARPRLNAVGNQLAGKGFESMDYYKNCTRVVKSFIKSHTIGRSLRSIFFTISRLSLASTSTLVSYSYFSPISGPNFCSQPGQFAFLNIENIHVMRESYQKMGRLVQRPNGVQHDATWMSAVESTGWLMHVREVLRGVLAMVTQIDRNRGSVLSHCSDGWDRTTQLCSLTELCLDPYYRTLEGFCVLIEKEWLSYGHMFQERIGHADQVRWRLRSCLTPQICS